MALKSFVGMIDSSAEVRRDASHGPSSINLRLILVQEVIH
jgi:hypothetical protein